MDNAPRSSLATMISKWRSVVPFSRMESSTQCCDSCVQPSDSSWDDHWVEDRLLEGFQTCTYSMPSSTHLPEEGYGYLIATLIRHHPPKRRKAVLHIHGWNEYFFQTHLAQFYEGLGYDFYAVDLHRYGRSLQVGELPGYMESVEDYFEELDACVEVISQDHDCVLLSGHSTGGLTAAIYASDRPKSFAGVILNAPWIDMQGSALFRALTPLIARGLSVTSPMMVLPASENHFYVQSLHESYYGEWDFNLELKKVDSQPVRPGWIRAVVNGHDRVGDGLHIDCPVLVATSAQSSDVTHWCEEAASTDLALDVERIAARVPMLGWHTTLVRIKGALHDVGLSREEVRERYFEEIRRWELAYVRSRRAQERYLKELEEI